MYVRFNFRIRSVILECVVRQSPFLSLRLYMRVCVLNKNKVEATHTHALGDSAAVCDIDRAS